MKLTTTQKTIRSFVRGAYDIQQLRIETGNRIVANYKAKLGIKPGTKEDKSDAEAKKALETIRASYKKITEGARKELPTMRNFKGDGVISDYGELCLIAQFVDLEAREDVHFRRLEKLLEGIPIYDEWLLKVKGCGPAMSGAIVSELDPHKARNISSFWKYCGLDVAHDGRGRSRRAEHLIDVEYVDKKGKKATRKSVTFNPWIKTKLYVLATCFIKCGGKYADIYRDYKNRLENRPDWSEKIKGHRHNAAMRYMLKQFLADLWVAWRTREGLPVTEPYAVAKLGMRPHGTDKKVA